MAVKQRRQIVSMRDRAWGEFSLWDVVCMWGSCLLFGAVVLEFCKVSRWVNSISVGSDGAVLEWGILEKAKI